MRAAGDTLPRVPAKQIPLWLKIAVSLFAIALVPIYWHYYSPFNFLYFCDLALLITAVAIWPEHRLLLSMAALSILLVQAVWIVDLVTAGRLLGLAAYMFDPGLPPGLRLLSLFHAWLPILLIFLLWRLGYDRRAIYWQSMLGIIVLLICYFLAPHSPTSPCVLAHPDMSLNINYVLGPNSQRRQTWMPGGEYLALLCAVLVVVIYLPTHWLLWRLFGQSKWR